MKGHLYTFAAISKINIIIAAVYTLVLWLFALYIGLFENTDSSEFYGLMFWGFNLVIWVGNGLIGTLLSKGKIRQYAITFPQGKKGYVASMYVFSILMIAVGFTFGGICTLLSGLETDLAMLIMMINIICILMWLQLFFTLVFGEAVGSIAALILILVLFYGVSAYFLFGNLSFFLDLTEEDIMNFFSNLDIKLKWILTVTNIGLLLITFPLSCKFVATEKISE